MKDHDRVDGPLPDYRLNPPVLCECECHYEGDDYCWHCETTRCGRDRYRDPDEERDRQLDFDREGDEP